MEIEKSEEISISFNVYRVFEKPTPYMLLCKILEKIIKPVEVQICIDEPDEKTRYEKIGEINGYSPYVFEYFVAKKTSSYGDSNNNIIVLPSDFSKEEASMFIKIVNSLFSQDKFNLTSNETVLFIVFSDTFLIDQELFDFYFNQIENSYLSLLIDQMITYSVDQERGKIFTVSFGKIKEAFLNSTIDLKELGNNLFLTAMGQQILREYYKDKSGLDDNKMINDILDVVERLSKLDNPITYNATLQLLTSCNISWFNANEKTIERVNKVFEKFYPGEIIPKQFRECRERRKKLIAKYAKYGTFSFALGLKLPKKFRCEQDFIKIFEESGSINVHSTTDDPQLINILFSLDRITDKRSISRIKRKLIKVTISPSLMTEKDVNLSFSVYYQDNDKWVAICQQYNWCFFNKNYFYLPNDLPKIKDTKYKVIIHRLFLTDQDKRSELNKNWEKKISIDRVPTVRTVIVTDSDSD